MPFVCFVVVICFLVTALKWCVLCGEYCFTEELSFPIVTYSSLGIFARGWFCWNALQCLLHGVHFRSPIDGKEHYLDPKVSIKIQEALGADIMFAFDECPSPLADENYMRVSLE